MLCIILNQKDRDYVKGGPCPANEQTAYGNGSQLNPIQRQGGGANPDPCYILSAAVVGNPDFASAQLYLSGLPTKLSNDPNFPALPEELKE